MNIAMAIGLLLLAAWAASHGYWLLVATLAAASIWLVGEGKVR